MINPQFSEATTNSTIYHHIGRSTDPNEWQVSHSDLNKIDPELGGHPKVFYKNMLEPSNISSASMENGNLLHEWIERKDQFIIADQDKPTEKLGQIAEAFNRLYVNEGYKTDAMFSSFCTQDYSIDMNCLLTYHDMFMNINHRKATDDEIKLFIYAFRYCRTLVGYNKVLKEPTVLEQFKPLGVPYISFLKQATGKIILTVAERDTLSNCYESVRQHPLAKQLFFDTDGQHEQELFWEINVGDVKIHRKAKLDKVIVDYNNKILTIPDLKTTSYPVALFAKGDHCPYKKYAYGRQLTSYAEGWFKANKIYSGDWKTRLINIVVQSNSEYPVMAYETPNYMSLQQGVSLSYLEERLAFHISKNNWDLTKEELENGVIEVGKY